MGNYMKEVGVSRQLATEPRELPWSARIVFTLTAVTAFVLGLVGFWQYLPANSPYGARPVDHVYHSLQLFVLDAAPLQTATDLPWTLEVARFAAPAVTVYLIFLAVQELFAERVMQARIRLTRGHSILCGPQDTVQQLADQIRRESGGKVVIVGREVRRSARRGFLHVIGDPRQRRTLERAGLARARELITVGPDSVLNAEVAIAVHAINREKETAVVCYAEALKSELFQAVVGQEVAPGEVNRLDTFNRHDRTARALLDYFPPELPADPQPAVLVIGYSGLGQVLVDHLVRYWSGGKVSGPPPCVCVLDADAPVEAVLRRHADASGCVVITARRYDPEWLTTIDDLLVPGSDGTGNLPDRVYVCLDDDAAGIAAGDTAVRLLADHESTVIVAVPHSGVLGYAASVNGPTEPASNLRSGDASELPASRTIGSARLLLISVVRTVYSIAAMRTGMNEQLAKTIHEAYCAHMMARGDSLEENNESIRPWGQLPEHLKDSNRDQAWDIGRKLALIGLSAAPARGSNGRITLTEEQVEMLAKVEHQRWMKERIARGWRHGEVRDNEGKRHPDLVDWVCLAESSREKDRSAIRTIPLHLVKAGLEIIRTK